MCQSRVFRSLQPQASLSPLSSLYAARFAALSDAFDRQKAEGLRLSASWRHGNRCYRLSDEPATWLGVAMLQWPSYADAVLARYGNDPRLRMIVKNTLMHRRETDEVREHQLPQELRFDWEPNL